jgi:hypothetical protein
VSLALIRAAHKHSGGFSFVKVVAISVSVFPFFLFVVIAVQVVFALEKVLSQENGVREPQHFDRKGSP